MPMVPMKTPYARARVAPFSYDALTAVAYLPRADGTNQATMGLGCQGGVRGGEGASRKQRSRRGHVVSVRDE